jgi:hypothetical protein
MQAAQNISNLVKWGKSIQLFINEAKADNNEIIKRIYQANNWFTKEFVLMALQNIVDEYLDEEKLVEFANKYALNKKNKTKTVGIILAGNIPAVGFHDILCIILSNHNCVLKLSQKDTHLMQYLFQLLFNIDPIYEAKFKVDTMIKGADAYITTSSNNTATYFEAYFGKYANIIRKNRNSVAVLDGTETSTQLQLLSHDIFSYFGLGCRNVSKIFVPENYNFESLITNTNAYLHLADHYRYRSNFDYQLTIAIMNGTKYEENTLLVITETQNLQSPISCLHYSTYTDKDTVVEWLSKESDNIQCVSGNAYLPFGITQKPKISDFADGVDTLDFLLSLN